jgi:hypothetical protein
MRYSRRCRPWAQNGKPGRGYHCHLYLHPGGTSGLGGRFGPTTFGLGGFAGGSLTPFILGGR